MKTHTIRLRAPWQFERSGSRCLWRRRFGRPTGLAPADRLWLVFEDPAVEIHVAVNGRDLGPVQGNGRLEITGSLSERNELRLTCEAAEPDGAGQGPPCRVSLQIESPGP